MNDDVDKWLLEAYDAKNFIRYLKRLGPCLGYQSRMTPEGCYQIMQITNYKYELAFQCVCGDSHSLTSKKIIRIFPNNGLPWKDEMEFITRSLPFNNFATWVERYKNYNKVFINEWSFDIHSAWRRPKFLGGLNFNFLLSCHRCSYVTLIKIDHCVFRGPICIRDRSVPFKTINDVRSLETELWRKSIWHTHMKHVHYTAGTDLSHLAGPTSSAP